MGNIERGFEYGYGAYFGRMAAAGTVALGLMALNAHASRPITHYVNRDAGGEHLQLMTVTQNGLVIGCYLYRLCTGLREPLTSYASYQEGLAGLDQWVRYLSDGGTVEEWREHNRAQAWIAWHQDWRHRMAEHAVQVKQWLKDHPEGKPYAEKQFKQACLQWVGAATLAAAENPELVEYAAKCGEVIMDTLKREAEAQKGKPTA